MLHDAFCMCRPESFKATVWQSTKSAVRARSGARLFFSSGLATLGYDHCPCAKIAWRIRSSERAGRFQTATSALAASLNSLVGCCTLSYAQFATGIRAIGTLPGASRVSSFSWEERHRVARGYRATRHARRSRDHNRHRGSPLRRAHRAKLRGLALSRIATGLMIETESDSRSGIERRNNGGDDDDEETETI